MKLLPRWLLALCLVILIVPSCDKDPISDTPEDINLDPIGTLRVSFKVSHPWIPPSRIVRTDLHIAKDGVEIYKGNYIESANVTDFQEDYFFFLSPGYYYYEAGIACICEGDSCSAGGFPGNQFGGKSTMGKFLITEEKVTTITPTFQ